LEPIPVETASGRTRLARLQAELAEQAVPLRVRLLRALKTLSEAG